MMAIDSPRPGSMANAGAEQARLALPLRDVPAARPLTGAAAVTATATGKDIGRQLDFAKPAAEPRSGAANRGAAPMGRPQDAPPTATATATSTATSGATDLSDLQDPPDLSDLPGLPAPLKGLGIPPLNTRQVGDFDKLDDLPPPVGLDIAEQLAVLAPPEQGSIDLRR